MNEFEYFWISCILYIFWIMTLIVTLFRGAEIDIEGIIISIIWNGVIFFNLLLLLFTSKISLENMLLWTAFITGATGVLFKKNVLISFSICAASGGFVTHIVKHWRKVL